MNVKAIFGEDVESGNHSEADDEELSPVEEMREAVSEKQIEEYVLYEIVVDMIRTVNGSQSKADDDQKAALREAVKPLVETKKKHADLVKDHPGNLPMFREAFPVEDRDEYGTDFYVLPSEIAAKIGIDYDEQDSLTLPIVDGKKWTPADSIADDVNDDDDDSEAESESDSESQEIYPGVAVPEAYTIPELKDVLKDIDETQGCLALLEAEKDGKDRIGAKKAIRSREQDLLKEKRESKEAESDGSKNGGDDSDQSEGLTDAEKSLAASLLANDDSINSFEEAKEVARSC